MDVRAILLVGASPSEPTGAETMGGVPLALLEVLGRPVVHHAIEHLRKNGIEQIAVLVDGGARAQSYAREAKRNDVQWATANRNEIWREAARVFTEFAQDGAELVLTMRLGAYAEPELEPLIQTHLDQRSRVTQYCDAGGPLDIFMISASRRNDAAYLFRHHFRRCRVPCVQVEFRGYVNRLQTAQDLRRLTHDAFLGEAHIVPNGREIKPGVWAGPGARVHKTARVLAPAYIGAWSKVRAAAVLTRGACLEHHTEVDCATVVEDTNVLPYGYVGVGLDVAHAVVGFRRIAHLRRNVEVEISDPKLIGMVSPHAPMRALASAASLSSFLPLQILRGLLGASHSERPSAIPTTVQVPAAPSPAALDAGTQEAAPKFPSNLAVARRYGNE